MRGLFETIGYALEPIGSAIGEAHSKVMHLELSLCITMYQERFYQVRQTGSLQEVWRVLSAIDL